MKDEKKKETNQDPLFNAGLDYLRAVRDIMNRIHIYFVEDDLANAYRTLCQLQIEIQGRLIKRKGLYEMVMEKQNRANIYFNISMNPRFSKIGKSAAFRNSLLDWFNEISIATHVLGLMMPDKPAEWDGTYD